MPGTLKLTDRLRGVYILPVNDGAGPLDGKDTFTREFKTAPIQHEAAEAIEGMTAALRKAKQLASIACDWHMEEVEIDGEMVDTHSLEDEFDAAIAMAGERP